MTDRRTSPRSEVCTDSGAGDGKSALRVVVVSLALIAAVLLVHLTPVRAYLSDLDHLRERLLSLGSWVYPAAIAGTALLLACGAPRLPLHAAGGMVFGFAPGLALTMIGAIVGHYCVFVFARWGGREWALSRW